MLLSLSLLSIVACGGDDKADTGSNDTGWQDTGWQDTGTDTSTDTADTTDTGTPATAGVRVLHLSPDAPNVDVFVDDVTPAAITDLAFLAGTPYIDLPAGEYRFRVAPTGGAATDAVLDVTADLAADAKYTAVAVGRVAAIEPLLLADDKSGLAAGSFRVQVVHAAAAVGEVDIWNLTGGTPSMLLENVPFKGVATLDLPAGAYRVGIDVNNDATPDVTFSLPNLPADLFVNLFAVSDATDTVWLAAQLPDGTVAPISAEVPSPSR
jgi:hypothetical protein